MADWSQLPSELVLSVASHITSFADHLRFKDVCRSWRSATAAPYLMVHGPERGLFSISNNKLYPITTIPVEVDVDESLLSHCHCFGSSHGWLALTDSANRVRLLNPLSGALVALPPLTAFPQVQDILRGSSDDIYGALFILKHKGTPQVRVRAVGGCFVWRACLSSPNPTNCTVMVLHDELSDLAYARPGEKEWITVESPCHPYHDLVYHEGRFYAVSSTGAVTAIHITASGHDVVDVAPPLDPYWSGKKYLVVLPSQGLAQAVRLYGSEHSKTTGFKVFKLQALGDGKLGWVEMESLGDWALFLGYNTSFALPSSQVCRADCVYFTDNCREIYLEDSCGGSDMGIFSLKDKTIVQLFKVCSSQLIKSPPIWITPNREETQIEVRISDGSVASNKRKSCSTRKSSNKKRKIVLQCTDTTSPIKIVSEDSDPDYTPSRKAIRARSRARKATT